MAANKKFVKELKNQITEGFKKGQRFGEAKARTKWEKKAKAYARKK